MEFELKLTGEDFDSWYENLELSKGSHENPDHGMCVNEAVAWITGSDFNEQPDCVSPVIRTFSIGLNDSLGDEVRTRLLKPRMMGMIGTNSGDAGVESGLAWMATDWLVRVHAPAWLRLAGLGGQAEVLAGLRPLDAETTPGILPVLEAVRVESAAAGDAAGAAAGDAAWDAAWAAAGDAAWAAAWAAARSAAGYAARSAAWDAAGAAAWDAARSAAGYAAGYAAGTALEPTVAELQVSASHLLEAMCDRAKQSFTTVGPS